MLNDVSFGDNNNGICSSVGGLYRTSNAGTSWTNVASLSFLKTNLQVSTSMFGTGNAWVANGNKVFHTNDNFATFKLDSVPPVTVDVALSSIFAVSESTVYASSYSGYFFKSINGGNTFSFVKKVDNVGAGNITDLYFFDANNGYMSNSARLYKTTDGGLNWSVVVALGQADIVEICFTDASHGWAICTDGKILKFN